MPGDEGKFGGCLAGEQGFVHISADGDLEADLPALVESPPPTENSSATTDSAASAELATPKRPWRELVAGFIDDWTADTEAWIDSLDASDQTKERLEATALDEDDPKHVQAAKAYFEIEGSLRPAGTTNVEVQTGPPVSDVSDEKLEALLAAAAQDELSARREAREAASGE